MCRYVTRTFKAPMTFLSRALSTLSFVFLSSSGLAQTLSLTFDDGLNADTQPRAREWNQQILSHLESADISAMVFPSLARSGTGTGLELIMDWAKAGHAVGNHTSRHRSLASAQVTLSEFVQDVAEGDAALRRFPTWVPMLRFPYLKEGDTAEKRDGMRAWMAANGYRAAPVSIDASDWYYNQIYAAHSKSGEQAKAAQVKKAYIAHLLDRASYYDGLAKQVLGRSPMHVMLLHTNEINAAALPDMVAAFRALGWRFVSPRTAFGDPVYSLQIDTLPAGESVIWAEAKAMGISALRYPAEDSVYEEPKLRSLSLLPQASSK